VNLKSAAHNLALRAELTRILHVFRAQGVPCIVLKGFPLLEELGEHLGSRPLADNDLLVARADARRAYDILVGDGLRSWPGRVFEKDLLNTHEHPLVRPESEGGGLVCELHWHAFPRTLSSVPETLIWGHTRESRVAGTPCRVLDKPLSLLHLTGHALSHELCEPRTLRIMGRAWSSWVGDIDMEELEQLARAVGLKQALVYVLRVAEKLGHAEVPAPSWSVPRARLVERLLPSDRVAVEAWSRFPERYWRFGVSLLLLDAGPALRTLMARALPDASLVAPGIDGPLAGARVHAARVRRGFRKVLGLGR
jgi:hypothetical protein